MKTTIYLSGPMTGIPEYNYPAFNAAAARWREAGYEVINPAEAFAGDTTLPRWVYLTHDIEQIIKKADAVAVLPGWEQSEGARLEVLVAQAAGLPIYEAQYVGTPQSVVARVVTLVPGLTPPTDPYPIPPTSPVLNGYKFASNIGWYEHTSPYIVTAPPTPSVVTSPDGVTLTLTPRRVDDYEGKVDGGGVKNVMFAKDKVPVELLPPMFMEGIAKVLQHGAKKYAPNNWMRGMKFSVPFGGLLRHILAWYRGERIDADSGLPHLFCAGCELLFLSWYTEGPNAADYADMDDRVYR
jgi:hypothetical protein